MEQHLIKFERCIFASMAIGIIIAALGMKSMTDNFGVALAIAAFQVLIIIIMLTVVLFITRRNSKFARWTWIVLFLAGLVFYIPTLGNMLEQGLIGILSAIQLMLQCLGTYFLFFGKSTDNEELR